MSVTSSPVDLNRIGTGQLGAYTRRPGTLSTTGYGGTWAVTDDLIEGALTSPKHGAPITRLEKLLIDEIPGVAAKPNRLILQEIEVPASHLRLDPHKFGSDQVASLSRWIEPGGKSTVKRRWILEKYYDTKLGFDRWYVKPDTSFVPGN